MSKKTTKPIQRQMLAAMLTTEPGRALFPLLRHIDTGVFEDEFSDPAVKRVVESLGRYYGKYKALPGKDAWEQWRKDDDRLRRWLDTCPDAEEREFTLLESRMFKAPTDEGYTLDKLTQFLTRMFITRTGAQEAAWIATGEKEPEEAFQEAQQARMEFMVALQSAKDGGGREFVDIAKEATLEGLEDTAGLATLVPGLTLYRRGLTVLAAPPKSFKTGILQAVAVDLARRGAWLYYIDLENGLTKSRRRVYQNLLDCPKEWLWCGLWVDAETLPYPIGRAGTYYERGDEITKVTCAKDARGTWEMELTLHKALKDGAEAPEDWKLTGELEIGDHTRPAMEVLEERLTELGGRLGVEYLKDADVDKITLAAQTFFHGAPPGVEKVVLVDWGQHVRNRSPKLSYWEKIRDNYARFKAMRDKHDWSMLMVEAPKDYAKLSDPLFRKKDLKMAGTENIGYDVEALLVMLATEEERERGYRRVMLVEDRDAASGENALTFLKLDYANMQVRVIEQEQHREDVPEFWAEREDGGTKSGKGKGFKTKGFDLSFGKKVRDE